MFVISCLRQCLIHTLINSSLVSNQTDVLRRSTGIMGLVTDDTRTSCLYRYRYYEKKIMFEMHPPFQIAAVPILPWVVWYTLLYMYYDCEALFLPHHQLVQALCRQHERTYTGRGRPGRLCRHHRGHTCSPVYSNG